MKNFLFALICFTIFSCSNNKVEESDLKPLEENKIQDTTLLNPIVAEYENNLNFDKKEGIVGIVDVPEMLSLCFLDSCSLSEMPAHIENSYALLEKDLELLNENRNSVYGQITYKADTSKFKFETFILINKVPKQQPKNASIVILESSKMLLYNYYGSYQKLFSAYEKIIKHFKKNKIIQSGPFREYYVTKTETEPDKSKWHTIIMVPVVGGK